MHDNGINPENDPGTIDPPDNPAPENRASSAADGVNAPGTIDPPDNS